MDTYTTQQILERCVKGKYLRIKENFGEVKRMGKTIRMEIIEEYGWNKMTCYFASKGGHLECLKYGFKVASDFKNRATS